MTLDEFWIIVDRVHAAAGFHMDEKCRLLANELRELPLGEIESWGRHYREQRNRAEHWDIHAIGCLHIGCKSDDAFMDFKSDLVSCGRRIFESVINDPDCMVELVDGDVGIEGYQYVAAGVYEELAGRRMPMDRTLPPTEGEKWTNSDDLERRFPRMWAKHGDNLLID